MSRSVGLGLLLSAVVAGCGGTQKKTVTVNRKVTVAAESQAATTGDPEDWCTSSDGDAIQQGASEAQGAFNDANVARFKKAVAKTMRAAASAPEGASCAVESLDSVVDLANDGSG